jgi:hypothetical protein
MKLTTKQKRIFQWLRIAMLGLMTLGGVVAGFNFAFLPAVTSQIGGAVAAIAGGVATWAGSVLPAGESGNEKPEAKPDPEILE